MCVLKEQKLFDIGMSLADASMSASPMPSSFEFGPRDLLVSVTKFLGRIRGCQSHLLPELLRHSETILSFSNPIAGIDVHWPALLEEEPETVGDLATQGHEESSSSSTGSWQDACDLTMLEPGASYMTLACDGSPF